MSECTKTSSTILDIENDLKKVEKKEKNTWTNKNGNWGCYGRIPGVPPTLVAVSF
jgi:hypothetical protein